MRCEVPNLRCGCRNQSAILGHAVQHAVRSHDRGVHRAGQDQRAYRDHEHVKRQAQRKRPHQAHGQAADQILQVFPARVVRNNHHRVERHQGSEQQAVNKNNQPGFFQILQLGGFNFAVHLRQGFFPAHGQDGMPHAHDHGDQGNHFQDLAAIEPSQGSRIESDIGGKRKRRKVRPTNPNRVRAPYDENRHHHRGDLHDAQGLLAGFVNSLDIFPPEINRDQDRKKCRSGILMQDQIDVEIRK